MAAAADNVQNAPTIDVSRRCHINEIAPFVTGQPVLKEIIIIDTVEQHGEHGSTYGKAADAEYSVYPIVAYVTQSG